MKKFVITKMVVLSELQWGLSRKLKETDAEGLRDGGMETKETEGSEEEVGETITG